MKYQAQTVLGDIADEWESAKLKDCLESHQSGDWGDDFGEVELKVLRSTNFSNTRALKLEDVAVRGFSPAKGQKYDLKRGDILVERSGGGPTQPVGRIVVVAEDMNGFGFSNFVQLLRSHDEMDADYLAWCLFQLHQSGEIERLQHQTTQMRNLDFRDYLKAKLPKPPKTEQERIGRALGGADAVLLAARAELEAARRAKTALLQTLFTRGLPGRHNEFRETKIGRLPAKWEVVTIQSVLSEPPFNGVSPESRPDPPGTPILNVSCIKGGRCSIEAVTYVDVDEKTIEQCRAQKGDFYVLRGNGNRHFVASGGLLAIEPPENCIFSDKLIRLRFNNRVAENFIPTLWLTNDFLTRLQSKAESGSGLWMMSKRDIRRQMFACPSVEEQTQILELIQSAEAVISAIETKVTALERVKTSLLQNLLTGRLRVAA